MSYETLLALATQHFVALEESSSSRLTLLRYAIGPSCVTHRKSSGKLTPLYTILTVRYWPWLRNISLTCYRGLESNRRLQNAIGPSTQYFVVDEEALFLDNFASISPSSYKSDFDNLSLRPSSLRKSDLTISLCYCLPRVRATFPDNFASTASLAQERLDNLSLRHRVPRVRATDFDKRTTPCFLRAIVYNYNCKGGM